MSSAITRSATTPAAGSITTAMLADDAVTAAKLADTAVIPGSYTSTNLTVDQQGRITAAASGSAGTGLVDNLVLKSDGANGLQTSNVTLADDGALSGQIMFQLGDASDVTLTAAFAAAVVGAPTGTVTLPTTPPLGTYYYFTQQDGDAMTIRLPASAVAYVGSVATSAAGTITSGARGSTCILIYTNTNQWQGLFSGTWTPA